jgi:hypothetical protein
MYPYYFKTLKETLQGKQLEVARRKSSLLTSFRWYQIRR